MEPVSDHVAKFHGDRSRDGGGKLAKEKKEKKTSREFYKSSRTTVTGGLITTINNESTHINSPFTYIRTAMFMENILLHEPVS